MCICVCRAAAGVGGRGGGEVGAPPSSPCACDVQWNVMYVHVQFWRGPKRPRPRRVVPSEVWPSLVLLPGCLPLFFCLVGSRPSPASQPPCGAPVWWPQCHQHQWLRRGDRQRRGGGGGGSPCESPRWGGHTLHRPCRGGLPHWWRWQRRRWWQRRWRWWRRRRRWRWWRWWWWWWWW